MNRYANVYTSSGGGGASSSKGNSVVKQASGIANPTTKEDFLNRAEFIAQVSENGAYKYEAFSSDWQKGDKDRTYIKIEESYQSGGKTRRTVDMGYYDNVTGKYYPGRAKDGDLNTSSVWNMSGSKKYSEAEIIEELKKRK